MTYFNDDRHDGVPEVTILRQSYHTATKPLPCGCKGTIQKGWRYQLTVGLEDGEFFSCKLCVGQCEGEGPKE